MPDPYAPAGPRRTGVSEVRTPLEQFVARLRDLGATGDEVAGVQDTWDQLDPDDSTEPDAFTRGHRDALLSAPDDQLLAMIAAGRAEYEHDTTTEADAADAEREVRYQEAVAEAMGRMGGNVDSILAWVGDDDVRALAVLHLETADEGADRKTLVGPLTELAGVTGEVTGEPVLADGEVPSPDPAPAEAIEVHHHTIGGPIDLEAATLELAPDDLPAADVGDLVYVHGNDDHDPDGPYEVAHVASFDPMDGHPVLAWGEAPPPAPVE